MPVPEASVLPRLRYRNEVWSVNRRLYALNRSIARGYSTPSNVEPQPRVSSHPVMPSRRAIVAVSLRQLRQKPTSKRWGKSVGTEGTIEEGEERSIERGGECLSRQARGGCHE